MLTSDPAFAPPFCPNPACRHHLDATGWRFAPHGFFRRQASPRLVRRFRCRTCRRTFSTQTFDTTYWLKRPDLQGAILARLVECSCFRQSARGLLVAPSTVQRQSERLGRHCLLFQREHGPREPPREPVVLDGFQTFEFSQYWPFDFNLLIGAPSHFLYAFTDSELRRSGRMTEKQRARRSELEAEFGRPDPRATEQGVEDLLRVVAPAPAELDVASDEHAAYPRAFRRSGHRIRHRTVSSRRSRTPRNPLFPVNLAHLLLRHCSSNHKRETIAFSKRRQSAAERLAVFQVWRNFVKTLSEKRTGASTPAMRLGLVKRPLSIPEVLARRLFPTRTVLLARLQRYYFRDVETRQVPHGRRHELRYAA